MAARSARRPTLCGVTRTHGLLLGALTLIALALAAAVVAGGRGDRVPTPDSTDVAAAPTPTASDVPAPSRTPPASQAPTPTPAPEPSSPPTPDNTPEPAPGAPTGDPRLAYGEFQLRLADAATEVQSLNAGLRAAAEDLDTEAVQASAVDILDFVDSERDWLRDHPPAVCYARAHAAAGDMLAAYGTVAEAALRWTSASGLEAIAALADLGVAVEDATGEAESFARAFEAVRCEP